MTSALMFMRPTLQFESETFSLVAASTQSMALTRLMMSGAYTAPAFVFALILYGVIISTEAQTATPAPTPGECVFC